MVTLSSHSYVYALSHPSMIGLLKIGATRKHPEARAAELSSSTSIPGDFIVEYYLSFDDPFEIERLVHEAFAEQRIDPSREFFRVDVETVARELWRLGEVYLCTGEEGGRWSDRKGYGTTNLAAATPFAELFASVPDDGSARELTDEEQAKCRALERSLARGQPL